MTTPLSGVPWNGGIDDRTAAVDANNLDTTGGGSGLADVDDPTAWAPASDLDYEFEGSGSTLPTGWVWVNQGSATYLEGQGAGLVTIPGTANVHTRGLFRPVSASSWTVTAKATDAHASSDIFGLLLMLRESSSGKVGGVRFYQNREVDAIVADDDNGLNFSTFAGPFAVDFIPSYFRAVKHSASSFDLAASRDGLSWLPVVAGWNASAHFAPDQVGVCALAQQDRQFAIHWLRVR